MPLALALAAAALWGVADFLGGLAARRTPLLVVALVTQLAGISALIVAILVTRTDLPEAGDVPIGLATGVAGVVGLLAFYRALAIGTMSVIAPITATGAAVPVLAGVASGERPSAVAWAGMAAATIGVVLASIEQRGDAGRNLSAGVGLAILGAATLGLYLVGLDASADGSGPLWAILLARISQATIFLTALLVVRSVQVRGPYLPLIAIGLIDTAANVSFAAASTDELLTLTAVLSSLYPVVTVALAHIHLHERLPARQWVGVALALTGVALIVGGG